VAQGVDLRAVGVTEAGGTFRPLRHYQTPLHLAGAKGVRNAQSSNTSATQRGQGKSGGNQQRLWLLRLRSCGQKNGIADRVFANPDGEPEYIRVRIGFFGMRAVLIPVQFVETDEMRKPSS
jgi:hypothetical protein